MKIGILTFHSSYNFGANLQVLATQSALIKLGATPVVINYQEPEKMRLYRQEIRPEQAERHEDFMRRYLVLSPLFTNPDDVEKFCLDSLDAVIVGSDAVFRIMPKFTLRRLLKRLFSVGQRSVSTESEKRLSPYWLPWRQQRKGRCVTKASIAASAEGCLYRRLKWSLYPGLWRSVRNFDFLSVRDTWTHGMIRFVSIGSRTPEYCPDPVFALEDAFRIPAEEMPVRDLSRTILLSGNLAATWRTAFRLEARDRGFATTNLPNPDNQYDSPEDDFRLPLPMSPLQWYSCLGHAAAFVGIRFHALVSCLAQATPAIGLDRLGRLNWNYKRRSKVHDLCERADVLERYSSVEEIAKVPPQKVLDTLFSADYQGRADSYAEQARLRFYGVLEQILQIADDKRTYHERSSSKAAKAFNELNSLNVVSGKSNELGSPQKVVGSSRLSRSASSGIRGT